MKTEEKIKTYTHTHLYACTHSITKENKSKNSNCLSDCMYLHVCAYVCVQLY